MTKEDVKKYWICILVFLASCLYTCVYINTHVQPSPPGFEILEPWKSIIRLTFIIPILLSWAFGALAFHYLMLASEHRPQEPSTRMLRLLGYGVLALVVGAWGSSLLGQARSFVTRNSDIDVMIGVLVNYMYVLFPLIGFGFIYRASKTRPTQTYLKHQNLMAASLFIVVLGALWVATIFTNDSRQVTSLAYGRPTYYISDPLIILTLIVPTLVAWFLGIAGALNFADLETEGPVPLRRAFSQIVMGVVSGLFGTIILTGLLSAGAERLLGAGLGLLLIIVYLFVFLTLFSYWMIYRGAKKLYLLPPP